MNSITTNQSVEELRADMVSNGFYYPNSLLRQTSLSALKTPKYSEAARLGCQALIAEVKVLLLKLFPKASLETEKEIIQHFAGEQAQTAMLECALIPGATLCDFHVALRGIFKLGDANGIELVQFLYVPLIPMIHKRFPEIYLDELSEAIYQEYKMSRPENISSKPPEVVVRAHSDDKAKRHRKKKAKA